MTEVGKAEPVLQNLEAFARAVLGKAAYPITGEEMIANISLLESIIRSAGSGDIERVA